MLEQAVDILILSNGPGELATWVRPVVKALRQQLGIEQSHIRISVVLSPCPNASGKEVAIAQSYPEVDRVQGAEDFLPFLLSGKTAENWDWRDRGVVLFLGGDQFFPVVIGKRLGYRTVIYAEWEARWYRWVDRFGVMKPEVVARVPQKYAHKFTVVGDLMADVGTGDWGLETGENITNSQSPITNHQSPELIGLLPGSKAAKLAQGVPLCLAIAQHIHNIRPQTKFVIPVAPTLDIQTLASFANLQQNPVIKLVNGATAELIIPDINNEKPYLKTSTGLQVELWTDFPAYDLLSQCCLCITTVGANTAELGSLAVPMIVLLPTQQIEAMRAWDGLPGLLVNLPGVGTPLAKIINRIILQYLPGKNFAWPNIWAKEQIVPELLGKLQSQEVALFALDLLNHPDKLQEMRSRLRQVRGQAGASQKLANIVAEEVLNLQSISNHHED
ncbi:putative lipid-A-disaccharide synthase [Crinalium epipsammum PCC 9333]|uniref:Putative lipid-A-disaccharide synthase n=1 Tax=Crinalium epipsammum PCC 9333 TaxID=1173022 RepID=K9W0J6_9CYAN|nr:lipid-A-disaccharide synthase [Crinalium epipsammum]AFZ13267.1 putative lipid-A-disaccharide synthase [Crinalium epipsammum PCC 9333]